MKKIISIVLIMSILMSLALNASAHTQVQQTTLDGYVDRYGNYCVGAESIGWSIDEYHHIGTTSITYRFDSNVPSLYKTMFRNAANSWNTNTQATVREISSGIANVLVMYTDELIDGAVAQTNYEQDNPLNNHLSIWAIRIRDNDSAEEDDLTHEIGHVFGLKDLYNTGNKSRLMYGYNTRTADRPTADDIKGFKVITGLHSNHTSWKYSNTAKWCASCGGKKTFDEAHNFRWTQYSVGSHKGYCPVCRLTVYENHSYYLNGSTCTRCGNTNAGGGTVSIPDDELVE